MPKKTRPKPPSKRERELEVIYAEIPRIPGCTGACASACGPIAMFKGEWERVKRTHGREPKLKDGLAGPMTCPMLSPTGKCMVYTMRPFICRLWGTTPTLKCPEGCEPERWLTKEEARVLFERVQEVAGPEVRGTLGEVKDLWEGFALEARETRQSVMQRIEEVARARRSEA